MIKEFVTSALIMSAVVLDHGDNNISSQGIQPDNSRQYDYLEGNNLSIQDLFDTYGLEEIFDLAYESNSILNPTWDKIKHSIITGDLKNFSTDNERLVAIQMMSAFYARTYSLEDPVLLNYYRTAYSRIVFSGEPTECIISQSTRGGNTGFAFGETINLHRCDWIIVYLHEASHNYVQGQAYPALMLEANQIMAFSNSGNQNIQVNGIDGNQLAPVIAFFSISPENTLNMQALKYSGFTELTADILNDVALWRLVENNTPAAMAGPYVMGAFGGYNVEAIPPYYLELVQYLASDLENAAVYRRYLRVALENHNVGFVARVMGNIFEELNITSDQITREETTNMNRLRLMPPVINFYVDDDLNNASNMDFLGAGYTSLYYLFINSRYRLTPQRPVIYLLVPESEILEHLNSGDPLLEGADFEIQWVEPEPQG